MLVLGITGQSGSGKGAVCDILRKKGVECLDTDKTARKVVEKGSPCLRELIAHFGLGILLPDGSMDRKKVASIVFNDKEELAFLTETTHRYIIEEIKQWLFERELQGARIVALDAPQLFDAGADFYCNFILAVLADSSIRLDRIMARDGMTEEAALSRMRSQKDDAFFKERCDFVIYNNGDFDCLERRVNEVFEALNSKTEYFE